MGSTSVEIKQNYCRNDGIKNITQTKKGKVINAGKGKIYVCEI